MIYTNGFIELLEGEELSFDEIGSPIVGELRVIGGRIPAMYQAVTDDKRGKFSEGTFQRQAYEVHITKRTIPSSVKRVRLYNQGGELLGEFPLQTIKQGFLTNRTALSLGA